MGLLLISATWMGFVKGIPCSVTLLVVGYLAIRHHGGFMFFGRGHLKHVLACFDSFSVTQATPDTSSWDGHPEL